MKTKIMSLGDRLRVEGMVIGEKKGREEGREGKNISATKNMLRKKFPVPIICEVLEVNPEVVQKVKKMLAEEK